MQHCKLRGLHVRRQPLKARQPCCKQERPFPRQVLTSRNMPYAVGRRVTRKEVCAPASAAMPLGRWSTHQTRAQQRQQRMPGPPESLSRDLNTTRCMPPVHCTHVAPQLAPMAEWQQGRLEGRTGMSVHTHTRACMHAHMHAHSHTRTHSHARAHLPLVFGPALAMERRPGPVCFATKFSSAKRLPYMLVEPVPSPCVRREPQLRASCCTA